jgi:hypothetical protein
VPIARSWATWIRRFARSASSSPRSRRYVAIPSASSDRVMSSNTMSRRGAKAGRRNVETARVTCPSARGSPSSKPEQRSKLPRPPPQQGDFRNGGGCLGRPEGPLCSFAAVEGPRFDGATGTAASFSRLLDSRTCPDLDRPAPQRKRRSPAPTWRSSLLGGGMAQGFWRVLHSSDKGPPAAGRHRFSLRGAAEGICLMMPPFTS